MAVYMKKNCFWEDIKLKPVGGSTLYIMEDYVQCMSLLLYWYITNF